MLRVLQQNLNHFGRIFSVGFTPGFPITSYRLPLLKMVTSENVALKTQFMKFISWKCHVPFFKYSILNHFMNFESCGVVMSISMRGRVHFLLYLWNRKFCELNFLLCLWNRKSFEH